MDPRSSLSNIKKTWHSPGELQCSRPREISLTWAGKILVGLAVAIFLGGIFAGLALYIKASGDRENRSQLVTSGLDTEAWITRSWTSGYDPVRYWVEYSYSAGGQTWTGRLATDRDSWLNLQKTETLKIRYLPADPQRHLIPGHESKLLPSWISILVAGISFLVGWLLKRILDMQRRLLAEGRPAPAIVTRITRSNQQHGKKVAHYVFEDLGGKLIEGKSNPQKKPPMVGSVLNVIYEPDQENHNRIYPLPLVKTRNS
jgi:hypothetical protein